MNLIKIFRKPLFSYILSSLTLIVSCSQYNIEEKEAEVLGNSDNNINLREGTLNIDKYVENQLIISEGIINLLENENDIDYILNMPSNLTYNELKSSFDDANIIQSSALADLLKLLQNNSLTFANKNQNLKDLTLTEIELIISQEIENQLGSLNYNRAGPCEDAFHTGHSRCARNFAISAGAVAISAFFTFGIGTFIGGSSAMAIYLACQNDVDQDYYNCID